MHDLHFNWLAIVVAGLVKFLLGWLWYSPLLFAKQWQALTGVTAEAMKPNMPKAIGTDLVASMVMAFVLAHWVHFHGWNGAVMGAVVGLINWAGFLAAWGIAQTFYEQRPFKLFLINNAYLAIALALMGAILGAWT